MKPEAKAKRKIVALEHKHAMIDALIEFIRTHPDSVDGAELIPLANRTGLRYVSHMPEEELNTLLDELHQELIPEDYEESS